MGIILKGNCSACGKERGDYKALTREFRYTGGEHICWARDRKCMEVALRDLCTELEQVTAERDAVLAELYLWKAL